MAEIGIEEWSFFRQEFNVATSDLPRRRKRGYHGNNFSFIFEQSNVELYSMDNSLANDELFVFTMYWSKNGNNVRIFVEKTNLNSVLMTISREEAKRALKFRFNQKSNDMLFPESIYCEEWIEPVISSTKTIAFELCDSSQDKKYSFLLKAFDSKEMKGNYCVQSRCDYLINTGAMESGLDNALHGLLILDRKFSLLECTKILCEVFPKEIIRKISYCPEEMKFRERYAIRSFSENC